jgi:hypothetical protein
MGRLRRMIEKQLDVTAERQLERRGAQRVQVDGQAMYVITPQLHDVTPKPRKGGSDASSKRR